MLGSKCAKPVYRNTFQGRNLMPSHFSNNGGDFLSPQRTNKSTPSAQWAINAMKLYKNTGCAITREALLLYYMGTFVKPCARRMCAGVPSSVDIEDLQQTAFFALDAYIDKFDLSMNFKFESFARRRIEGAMLDFLRREDPASRLARSRSKMISSGISAFYAQHGRRPEDNELRAILRLDESEFIAVMRDIHVPGTISYHPSEGDNEQETSRSIHIEVKNEGFSTVERSDLHAWLYKQLGHYDLLIVTLTYSEGLTMLETGQVLGFSESRISQRLKQIHGILKTRLLDYPEERFLMVG
jgi:RNA polymerase sigma factor for flagellar operon FliA